MSASTDDLARVLAKHQLADVLPYGVSCTCGADLASLNPPLDDGAVNGEALALAVHQLQEMECRPEQEGTAMSESTLDASDFERRVSFEPGYNYLHETGPHRRGQHGMRIRFLLIGPEGAAQFVMQTFWTPLGEVDKGPRARLETVHIDHWRDTQWGTSATINPPSGRDLGYHWPAPQYEGQPSAECDVLPGGVCFYDGSALAADDVLRDFIREGEAAVWRWLAKRYQWCLESDAEMHDRAVERLR